MKDEMRKAPKGAKSPVPPLPPRAPRVIDVTPTWRAILPVLLTVYKDGNAAGQMEADRELHRMADLADIYVKLAQHSPETVRQLLDQIKASDG